MRSHVLSLRQLLTHLFGWNTQPGTQHKPNQLSFLPSTPTYINYYRNKYSVALGAKHVQNKAARKANHNRPRKSRPSDINRAPVVYPTFTKPAEYTIVGEAAAPAAGEN